MSSWLTFVIPVRHQDNSKDWGALREKLSETAASIARQTTSNWNAIIVANHGADIAELPRGFQVERVDFSPNLLHEQGNYSREEFYEALRADKGRRVLAGLLSQPTLDHVMIVDDDDLVSNRLASFVQENAEANGWYIDRGYLWNSGNLLYLYDDFSHLCGTSHIIRADLLKIPPSINIADINWIKTTLGSHVSIANKLARDGTPLAALPFAGAIYRIGHPGSHSGSQTILKKFFIQKELLRRPRQFLKRLLRLRLKIGKLKREFFP